MRKYRKIMERLDAVERRAGDHDQQLRRHEGDRRGRDGGRDHHGRDGGDYDEKRIIDTIVRLVSERVGQMLEGGGRSNDRDDRDDWREEKRKVDFIVDLVCERVEEIVATELDRRLGPAASTESPSAPGGEVARRRGGRRRDPEER
jgi:hypothetical protein